MGRKVMREASGVGEAAMSSDPARLVVQSEKIIFFGESTRYYVCMDMLRT